MNFMLTANTFKVSLMLSARISAEKFRCQQNNPKKAKEVYLNNLAVSAVEIYLKNLGWITSRENCDSWNPIMQTLMNVADLEIPNYGKIECRAVLCNQQELVVPPEVQSERIAYIFVKFGSSLQECELLGFVPEIKVHQISLSQLQPIENLTSYLREYKNLQDKKKQESVTELSKWWQEVINDGWQLVEQVFPSESILSFRSPKQLQEKDLTKIEHEERSSLPSIADVNTTSQVISRVKLLDLVADSHTIPIALILQLEKDKSEEINISVKVHPTNTCVYLPEDLEIMILDEAKKTVLQAKANKTNEAIEFLFSGERGEIFSIQTSFQDNSIVETFII